MKKHLITVASVAMLAGVVSFSSCKKDDTTAPTITIAGGNSTSQSLPAVAGNGTFTVPTATAADDVDGDISASVTTSGTVDANNAGIYTVTYTVSDAAGNSASEVLTVNIVNDASFLGNLSSAGVPTSATYNAHDTCQVTAPYNYSPTVLPSATVNNAFKITNFGAFGTSIIVNGTLSGSTISIPASQSLGGTASIVAANGTVTSTTAPVRFGITYTWTDGTSNEVCISAYTHQ